MNGFIADNGTTIEYFLTEEAAALFSTTYVPAVLPEGVEALDRVEPIMLWDGADQYLFPNPTVAYNHAREHKTCLTDKDGKEVYCARWDH